MNLAVLMLVIHKGFFNIWSFLISELSISGLFSTRLSWFYPSFEYLQNPTWRSLDFGIMPDRLDTSVSCFVVRIWGGKKEHFQLLIEWKVNLDGLKYLGQQVM